MATKEEIYDSEISPLMQRIIATCKRAGISCLCTFDITAEPDSLVMCTTFLPDETGRFPERIAAAERIICPRDGLFVVTISHP